MKIEHMTIDMVVNEVLEAAYPGAKLLLRLRPDEDVLDVTIYRPDTKLYHAGAYDLKDIIG